MTQDRSRERQVNRCRTRSSLFQRRAFVYTYGETTSQNLWSRYARHFVGTTCVELTGEDLPCYSNKI